MPSNPHSDEIIRAEIPDIARIVQDECWLEAERRGHPIDRHDPTIQQRVAEIILSGVGRVMRQKYSRADSATLKLVGAV